MGRDEGKGIEQIMLEVAKELEREVEKRRGRDWRDEEVKEAI